MTFCIRRREFIAGLGGAAAWPVTAHAQPRLPVIGFLGSESLDLYAGRLRAFHQGLRETGFAEGRSHRVSSHGTRCFADATIFGELGVVRLRKSRGDDRRGPRDEASRRAVCGKSA